MEGLVQYGIHRNHTRAMAAAAVLLAAAWPAGGLLAGNLVTGAGVDTPASLPLGSVESQTSLTRFSPGTATDSPAESIDYDRSILCLLEALCMIVRCDAAALSADPSTPQVDLVARVHAFIGSFESEGIKPHLTGEEIAAGLATAMNARALIAGGAGAPGTMGPELAGRLDTTLCSIIATLTSLEQARSSHGG